MYISIGVLIDHRYNSIDCRFVRINLIRSMARSHDQRFQLEKEEEAQINAASLQFIKQTNEEKNSLNY